MSWPIYMYTHHPFVCALCRQCSWLVIYSTVHEFSSAEFLSLLQHDLYGLATHKKRSKSGCRPWSSRRGCVMGIGEWYFSFQTYICPYRTVVKVHFYCLVL